MEAKGNVMLHPRSALNEVVTAVRNEMGEFFTSCTVKLSGRLPTWLAENVVHYIEFLIQTDELWRFFAERAANDGPLHLYVDPVFPQTHPTTFMGLLTGVVLQLQSINHNASGIVYSQFPPDYTPMDSYSPHPSIPNGVTQWSHEHTEYGSSSAHFHTIRESYETSNSESNVEESPTGEDSSSIDDNVDIRMESEIAGTVRQRKGMVHSRTVPDNEISFYHTGFSLGPRYRELDEDGIPPRYSPTRNILERGMIFQNYEELKQAVTWFCMKERKQFKTSYKRVARRLAVCRHPHVCQWSLQASQLKDGTGHWKIKKLSATHTCRIDYANGGDAFICTSKVIAAVIKDKITVDPEYKIKLIQLDVSRECQVDVGYKKVWYGLQKCIQMIYGDWDDSYDELPQFLWALKQTNPGTVVDLQFSETGNPNTCEFKYAFWVLQQAVEGFCYCLPVITIYGTHLYGKYKGHLLLAVALNANKEIFPFAYSIVDGENGDSWKWFLRLLSMHIIGDSQSVCIISDRHKGIESAFEELQELQEPRVHHRYCLRHIRNNVMTRYGRTGG